MTANGQRDWNVEPMLEDLIADPVTQVLMARDGVIALELIALLSAARSRFEAARDGA